MSKLCFASDYQEGAHPAVLKRLCDTNLEKSPGYGTDRYCASAAARIREACRCPEAAVHFLVGGTQTNATVIDALLKPWQGVIAAEAGHISLHEAGAIERGGHKVLTLPHSYGKLDPAAVEAYCREFQADANRGHMVAPGMVYLSQPTEYGTLYSLRELSELREICNKNGLLLYADGARLAYGLACPENDVSLEDLARLCDVFYIGGTKCGALFGEAVVIPDPALLPAFFTICKQHGALLAKGRLLGLQFDALFSDGLYDEIGKTAIRAAGQMREAFVQAGFRLAVPSPTNQIFVALNDRDLAAISEKAEFSFWEKSGSDQTIVRAAASWATTAEDLRALRQILQAYAGK